MKLILFILLFPFIGFSQSQVAVSLSPAEKVYIEPFDSTITDKRCYHYQIGNTCHAVYEDKYGKLYFIVKDRLNGDRIKFEIKPFNKNRVKIAQ